VARKFVLCADGTCNAFGPSSSNVARLLELIELTAPATQIACYDQGLGTRLGEHKRVRRFRDRLGDSGALYLVDPPKASWLRPWTWRSLVRAMADGTGLDIHLRQLYRTLAALHEEKDEVYFFGFSRGAFTVRALAGLVWRYGLPRTKDPAIADATFDEAWPLFVNEFPDEDGHAATRAAQFRRDRDQRECPIEFLGLWDTVKSYGGLRPVMLPHLRHNPSVAVVRHAMSLDEQRGWFELTTWGWLDGDRKECAAASRLDPEDADVIRQQKVVEVWFTGCHADVGGGGRDRATADIALRWMLGEAQHFGLRLNDAGRTFLSAADQHPRVTPSRTLFWKVVERKQREAIVNAGRWPARVIAPRGASPRHPLDAIRQQTLWHHETTTDLSRFGTIPDGVTLQKRPTLRTPASSSVKAG